VRLGKFPEPAVSPLFRFVERRNKANTPSVVTFNLYLYTPLCFQTGCKYKVSVLSFSSQFVVRLNLTVLEDDF